jgi:uncharacterized protein
MSGINGVFETVSGRKIDYGNPDPRQIEITDIAAGLRMPRFVAQTNRLISVAEHSCRVSAMLERDYPDEPDLWLEGLMHDAAEAYVVDLPRPLKYFPGIREAYLGIEKRVASAIAVGLGLPDKDLDPRVRAADNVALVTERNALRRTWDPMEWPDMPDARPGVDPLGIGLPVQHADVLFMVCYYRLRTGLTLVRPAEGGLRFGPQAEMLHSDRPIHPMDRLIFGGPLRKMDFWAPISQDMGPMLPEAGAEQYRQMLADVCMYATRYPCVYVGPEVPSLRA